MNPPEPPGRPVLVGAVLAVVLVGAALVSRGGAEGPRSVITLPAVTEIAPRLLADGTPVFVHRAEDGRVVVTEALAPETLSSTGIGELVAWCQGGEMFVAGHHGRGWAQDGRRYVGSNPGRLPGSGAPAPLPLLTRTVEAIEGRDGPGDPVRVGGPPEPLPSDAEVELVRPQLRNATDGLGPPVACRVPARPRLVPLPVAPINADPPPVDHGGFAEPLRAGAPDGWHVTNGHLLVAPDGAATWCETEPAQWPPVCPEPGVLQVELAIAEEDTGGAWTILSGPMAVRVTSDRIDRVAAMFSTRWHGSSLRGAVRYRASLLGVEPASSILLLRPVEGEPECVGPTRVRPGEVLPPPGAQYVDVDTAFDVSDSTDPFELANDISEDHPVDVDVRTDRATCRALSVTDAG